MQYADALCSKLAWLLKAAVFSLQNNISLTNWRRLNTAITRARLALLMNCNSGCNCKQV